MLRKLLSVSMLLGLLLVGTACEQNLVPPKPHVQFDVAAKTKAAEDLAAAARARAAELAVAARVAEVKAIAEEAYLYGYPLITSEIRRLQMSSGKHSPPGAFLNIKRYPPADYHGISAPNADTLYSLAWLDVGKEPMVFSHPDMGKRFYLFPMYSLWMSVIDSPGSRTRGQKAAKYLITGPGWQGKVPRGMTEIRSPTRHLFILGRTHADGSDADYKAVNALQARYKLVPLSAYGKPYKFVPPPPPDSPFSLTDTPQQIINTMDTSTYFNLLARLMGEVAPPAAEDAAIVASMASIGIEPGKPFDMSRLDPVIQEALQDVGKGADIRISAHKESFGSRINGWQIPPAAGRYGNDYLNRAVSAAYGWPANLPQDAVYPSALIDGDGKPLNGAHKYTLTFAKGQLPPVNGFWSITMYIEEQNKEKSRGWWFYPNPHNRFTISLRNKPKFNPDGSLTLYFQHESPGRKLESNWLPAPSGDFLLTMRMYWPRGTPPSILPPGQGSWAPPPVVMVKQ
jgi:hypothetical protein